MVNCGINRCSSRKWPGTTLQKFFAQTDGAINDRVLMICANSFSVSNIASRYGCQLRSHQLWQKSFIVCPRLCDGLFCHFAAVGIFQRWVCLASSDPQVAGYEPMTGWLELKHHTLAKYTATVGLFRNRCSSQFNDKDRPTLCTV